VKRHLDAVWCYRDALAHDPAAIGVWTNLGNALTQLNHLKSAIASHRRAIALSHGKDALLHHNLGVSLSEARQHGEAVVAFTHARELKPDYDMARWDRALGPGPHSIYARLADPRGLAPSPTTPPLRVPRRQTTECAEHRRARGHRRAKRRRSSNGYVRP